MSISMKNAGNSEIQDWKVELNTSEADISSIWCVKKNVSGTTVVITPESYNANIPANGAITFGYGGNGSLPSSLNYTISYKVNGTWHSYQGADSAL